ncbi:MAG TPA: TonB-dependent receptor, partial [Bryobacteraceae bacterium]|nr:TonB-dependent receptor [Bryobacteraceae bacterium]
MVNIRFFVSCGGAVVAGLIAAAMLAAPHQGVVRSNRQPVPGATVTATQGERKVVTTTSDDGTYSITDLPEGVWTIQVEMLGFESARREVQVGAGTASTEWDLRFLSEPELARLLTPGTRVAATAAAPSPAPAAPAKTVPARQAGRGQASQSAPEFQQVQVSQSSDVSLFDQQGVITDEMNAELSPSANPAYLVQGSMSSALGLPGEDGWGPFGGRGMMGGPGMMGMGPGGLGMEGPAGMGGMPGMGGEAGGSAGDQAAAMGAGAGRGGEGGPMAAGGRGGSGGPMMVGGPGGGRGGGMGGRGGPGGAGGRGAGRGGPEWMGRGGALAFGNNRRDPRMMYTGNLAINGANSLLNAQQYSLSGQNIPKPYSNNTSVNASFGGPLKIPKLTSGRQGQFTVSFGFGRNRNGQQGSLTTMPSELERAGDFSQSVGANGKAAVIYDPTTGAPFPLSRIPESRISSIARALIGYYPLPNLPGQTRNFQLPTTRFNNSDNLNLRINQTLTTKDRVSGGFGYSGASGRTPDIFGFTDTTSGRGMNANLSYSRNFTSRLISTLNYTFSRNRNLTSPFFAYKDDVAGRLGIQGVSADPINWGPPNLSFTNFAGLSDAAASLARSQTSSLTASLVWVRGTHNLMFGSDYRRQQNNRYSDPNGRGSFTFNGYATSRIIDGAAAAGTGFDLAGFLLGTPDAATVRYGASSLYFRGSMVNLYMQDDWRLHSRFSINFGLRWEYQSPVRERYNRLVNLAIAPNFTAITAVQPGDADPVTGESYPPALMRSDPNNFSPRVGLAWRISAKRSTIVRAGYGIYYNSSAYSGIASQMAQQPPLATVWNLNIQNSPLLSIADAFTNPANIKTNSLTSNTFAADPNYRIGYVQQWNFAIQQNLPYSFQTTAAYQGSKGTHLDRQFQPWVTPPNAPASGFPTGYTYQTFGGTSIYHAGSIQLMRRFRAGLSAGGSYVFSKSIDSGGAGGAIQVQDWQNFRAERALSSFDQRHSVNVNFSYSTGQGRRGGGLVTG